MSSRCHVSTRRDSSRSSAAPTGWRIARTSFLGDNVTLTMHDPRDGALYAALNHGHFGVKLHRSRDGGATWQPIADAHVSAQARGLRRRRHRSKARRPTGR